MQLIYGNAFTTDCDALCITTNGFVKNNGHAVMGKGIAKNIQRYCPNITKDLGELIETKGNNVHLIYRTEPVIISFPVKPISGISDGTNHVSHLYFSKGERVPGWAMKAEIEVIKQSAYQLVELADSNPWNTIVLPRPGCGAGELSWEQVEPVLANILDDRFKVITYMT